MSALPTNLEAHGPASRRVRPGLFVLVVVMTALAGCESGDSDADGDGLIDAQERAGWIVDVAFVDRVVSYHVTSDPTRADADGDGLLDVEEYLNGLDPHKADTDEDGLTDCQETTHRDRETCERREFCPAAEDCSTGTDPLDADSDAQASRYVRDVIGWSGPSERLGGDGVTDGDELAGYEVRLADTTTWHVTTDPRRVDTDGDGLHDGEERTLFRTNAQLADTDGDGCDDGQDPFPRQRPEHQEYFVGLDSITLHQDADGDGTAHVVVEVVWGWAAQDWTFPPSGHLTMAAGATRSLAPYEPAPVAVGCPLGFIVIDPWLPVFVLARDDDGGSFLDITADATATGSFWWNIHTGQFAIGPTPGEGDVMLGPVELVGPDATVRLWPRVEADEPALWPLEEAEG
jgi:hypothetical protein